MYLQLREKERLEEKQIHHYQHLLSCAYKEHIFLQKGVLNKKNIDKYKDFYLSFKAIFKLCHPRLKALSLAFLPITDETITALAAKCPDLITLDLTLCRRITDRALKLFAERFPKLRYLSLCRCTGVTREGFNKLIKARPELKYHFWTPYANIDEHFDSDNNLIRGLERDAPHRPSTMRCLKRTEEVSLKSARNILKGLEREDLSAEREAKAAEREAQIRTQKCGSA